MDEYLKDTEKKIEKNEGDIGLILFKINNY